MDMAFVIGRYISYVETNLMVNVYIYTMTVYANKPIQWLLPW